MIIKSLLDTDLYKFSMLQPIWRHYRSTTATTRFICRTPNVDLRPYAEEIKNELKSLCNLHFLDEEINYLRSQGVFKEAFLSWLKHFKLDYNQLNFTSDEKGFHIEATGPWHEITLFEIFTLSIVNEVYFRNTQPQASKEIGRSKLMEKIRLINEVNAKAKKEGKQIFKLSDFGTRRRFSASWHQEVVETLKKHLSPESFVGTSSVYLAKETGVKASGTSAHEWLQAFQRLASSLRNSQKEAFEVWIKEYDGKLGIALSDIYGTAPFLNDFNLELATKYQGARHDSGDPVVWGKQLIAHYQKLGIDPKTKTLIFSDGLTVPKAIEIYKEFRDQINLVFGIGTSLTNDLNFKALNIVMKLVTVNGLPVCKISEEPSKAICDDPQFLQEVKDTFGVKV